jgi:calcium-translocating P-type ATPase
MMVASMVTSQREYTVSGTGYDPEGEITGDDKVVYEWSQSLQVDQLITAAVLCNDASLRKTNNHWMVEGDPMEGAFLVLSKKAGNTAEDIKRNWIRTDIIPFDSQHRFMATLQHNHEREVHILVKGAPEKVLELCRQQLDENGNHIPLEHPYWDRQIHDIANQGQRVLALAMRPVSRQHTSLLFEDVNDGMILLGIIGLIDPPRTDAITAVAECRSAGIRVKMITGDHALTATAIGRKIGLENPDSVLTGVQLDEMDGEELSEAVRHTDIFARTSPGHKLRLVMALQSQGEVVAMTGDGVNDAPALKRADAGIAMGMKGSEAAKEASDLVLMDDNFATIVAAISEGRTVYDNIVKVIGWTLPTNAGETATITLALLAGMSLPVTPIQILWINLITVSTLGLAMAFEPAETGAMSRPPRPRDRPLLSGTIIWQIVLVSLIFLLFVFGIFFYATEKNYPVELARTMALNTIVVMEIFYLFFIKNLNQVDFSQRSVSGTPTLWLTVTIIVTAQLLITYLPSLQRIFDTRPLSPDDGLLVLAAGIMLYIIAEGEKQLRMRLVIPKLTRK